jgi:hypothetical protein
MGGIGGHDGCEVRYLSRQSTDIEGKWFDPHNSLY